MLRTLVSGTGQAPAYGGQPVLPVAQAETVGPAAGRGQQKADAAGKIDREVHGVDVAVVRAHQHAADVKRGEETRRQAAPGRFWNGSPRAGGERRQAGGLRFNSGTAA